MLAASSLWKTTNESAKFAPFVWARERISIKMHSTESRCVIGPSNILFGGVYVIIIIIIKRISRAPIYHTRWQHKALYNNTNHTHTHTHTHTTHTNVCSNQPGNFTGWGSEGVNMRSEVRRRCS